MSVRCGPMPVYLLAGGPGSVRTDRDIALQRVIAAHGVAAPSVAYIGAASGDNRQFFSRISHHLRANGASEVRLAPTVGARLKLDETKEILRSADLVLVSGGDVKAGMEILREHGLLPFLGDLFQGGTIFFGISAGSIMLAREWILWDDPEDDTTASLFPCMGFAPVICDTHGEDEEWAELRVLLRQEPDGTVGYGIPSGAGLCVHADGTTEALGGPIHRLALAHGKLVRRADLDP